MSAGIIYNNGAALTSTAAGTSGQVLTSQGSGSPPIWGAGGGGGGNANAFNVYLSTTLTGVTGDGSNVSPIIYDTLNYDIGSNYNTGTGFYTAPATGLYYFYATIRLDALLVNNSLCQGSIFSPSLIFFNPADFYFNPAILSNGGICVFNVFASVSLTSGDAVGTQLFVSGNGTPNVNIFGANGWQNFGGWQIA